MDSYKDLQQKVFNWLKSKYDADNNFTFSVRQNANKGAELNYFIGTEKSKYFSTTFWFIPVSYPGSSSDLIDLVFEFNAKNGLIEFYIQFNQTKNPQDEQNKYALEFIRNIKPRIKEVFPEMHTAPKETKMEFFSIKTVPKYKEFSEMEEDLEKLLETVIPIVDREIDVSKKLHPDFVASKFSVKEQDEMIKKMNARFTKYKTLVAKEEDIFLNILQKISASNNQNLIMYYTTLDKLIEKLQINKDDQRVVFSIPQKTLRLNFIVGQRVVWNILSQNSAFEFISKEVYSEKFENFEGDSERFLNQTHDIELVKDKLEELLNCAEDEIKSSKTSSYISSNNKYFKQSAFDKDYRNKIFEDLKINAIPIKISTTTLSHPTNQILFGPPGTGKTYNTINKTIEIINPEFDLSQDRKTIKEEFEKLHKSGQIVFTTFHKSMSYEDFIEGIKPMKPLPNDNGIKYDIEDGVFKTLSNVARSNYENSKFINKMAFEDAFEQLKEEWEEDNDLKFPMKTRGKDFTILGFSKSSISFKKASGGTNHTLSVNTLRDYYYNQKEETTIGLAIYYSPILKKISSYKPSAIIESSQKQYVLIIDEINRGDVSQIFGELITLIEDDKRIGNPEALEITLPYSKERFGVPLNLYIIGTMNTADRSVEALDTALRRRFSFVEMPPRYDLEGLNVDIYGYKANVILKTINDRIEKLIDKDHIIGHSYFLNKNQETIVHSFYTNIIPLLQEYFFNDSGKIGLVLGKGFVEISSNTKNIFAKFNYENVSDFSSDTFRIIDYRDNDVEGDFETAIQTLMNDKD